MNEIACNSNLCTSIADDFKPASVDTTRPAELVVGDTNEITVTVPHVQVLANIFFHNFSYFVSLRKFKCAVLDQASFEEIAKESLKIESSSKS